MHYPTRYRTPNPDVDQVIQLAIATWFTYEYTNENQPIPTEQELRAMQGANYNPDWVQLYLDIIDHLGCLVEADGTWTYETEASGQPETVTMRVGIEDIVIGARTAAVAAPEWLAGRDVIIAAATAATATLKGEVKARARAVLAGDFHALKAGY